MDDNEGRYGDMLLTEATAKDIADELKRRGHPMLLITIVPVMEKEPEVLQFMSLPPEMLPVIISRLNDTYAKHKEKAKPMKHKIMDVFNRIGAGEN